MKKKGIYKKHIRAHAAVILSLFLMLSLIGSGFPYSGAELNSTFTYAASQTAGDFEYTVSGGTVTLTAYNGKDAAPKIPASIGGNKVTAIGPECFRGNAKITTINVPEGITSIGDYAFEACSGVTSLTLPASLETIGKSAFSGDAQLREIDIPKNVSKIGDGAFLYCMAVKSITGGEGLTELGQFVFAGCESVFSMDLSKSGLKALPDRTFCNCTRLFEVKLPDSIETVGKRAFSNCDALGKLEFGPKVKTVGDYAFEKCSNLAELSFEGLEGLKLGSNEFNKSDGVVKVHLRLPDNTVITDTTLAGAPLGGVYVSGKGNLKTASGKTRLIKNGQIYEDNGAVLVNALPEKYDNGSWVKVCENFGDKSYTRYTVDQDVQRIADGAFDGSSFDIVVLPAGIKELDDQAFYGAEIKAISISGDNSKYAVVDGMLCEIKEAAGNGGLGATLGTAQNSAVTESPSDADKTVSSDTDNKAPTDAGKTTSVEQKTESPDVDGAVQSDEKKSSAVNDGNADVATEEGTESAASDDTAVEKAADDGKGNDASPSAGGDEGGENTNAADADNVVGNLQSEGTSEAPLAAAADSIGKYRLLRFFRYKVDGSTLVKTTIDNPIEDEEGSRTVQQFVIPDNIVSIAPYAFSNAGVHVNIPGTSSLTEFVDHSFTNSGIRPPNDTSGYDFYGIVTISDAVRISISGSAFDDYDTYYPTYDDDGDDSASQTIEDLDRHRYDNADPDRDPNDLYDRSRLVRREDGEEYVEMPSGDGDSGESDATVKFTSESGDKSLYSDSKYSGYQVIPNSKFPAWSEKYLDYNKADIEFTAELMPYTMLYKGEAHYRSMVCVLNGDQYKTDYSIRNVGDDFAPMYLTMDHALEAEIQRGGVPDDIVLYSGITVERMADIAGTDKSAEEPPSLNQLKNAIGKEFTDPAFMSTTTNPSIAASFSSHSNTMIVIYASSEALSKLGAVVIDSFSGWGAGEYEILLNLGAKFKVIDVGTLQVSSGGETQYERQYIRLQLMVDDETSSITYDLNGGSYNGSTDNIVEKHKTGDVITVHEAPVREGYTFSYWKGSEYHPGETYVVNGDHTFTAVWVADKDSGAAEARGNKDTGGGGERRPDKRGKQAILLCGWVF